MLYPCVPSVVTTLSRTASISAITHCRYKQGKPLSILDGVPYAIIDGIDALPYGTTAGTTFVSPMSLSLALARLDASHPRSSQGGLLAPGSSCVRHEIACPLLDST